MCRARARPPPCETDFPGRPSLDTKKQYVQLRLQTAPVGFARIVETRRRSDRAGIGHCGPGSRTRSEHVVPDKRRRGIHQPKASAAAPSRHRPMRVTPFQAVSRPPDPLNLALESVRQDQGRVGRASLRPSSARVALQKGSWARPRATSAGVGSGAGGTGFEPATFCLGSRHSARPSYSRSGGSGWYRVPGA